MGEKITVVIDADLREIIPTFLENRKGDKASMQTALEAGDLKKIESIAHKLAGNAGSYGLPDLGNIGSKMEAECQRGDIEAVKSSIEMYINYLENLHIEYDG